MLQEQSGAVNALLVDVLHVMDNEPFWLLGNTAFWSMVMTSLWTFWPFAFLIFSPACRTSRRNCTTRRGSTEPQGGASFAP